MRLVASLAGIAAGLCLALAACGSSNNDCKTTDCPQGGRSFLVCGSSSSAVVTEQFGEASCQIDTQNPSTSASLACEQSVSDYCAGLGSGGGSAGGTAGGSGGGSGGSSGGSGGGSGGGSVAGCALQGHACGADGCCSGTCSNDVCACTPAAGNCASGNQCCSGVCASGICAPANQVGQLCSTNANCEDGNCQGGVCECVGAGSGCIANADCCSGTSCDTGSHLCSAASGTGTVGGLSFANPSETDAIVRTNQTCSGSSESESAVLVVIGLQGGTCTALENGAAPTSGTYLLLEVLSQGSSSQPAIATGTYAITTAGGSNAPVALAEVVESGLCSSSPNYISSSGQIELDSIDSGVVSGRYSITFTATSGSSTATLSGSFSAATCSIASTCTSYCPGS